MVLIVLLLDVSGSMALGSRIEALNSNVRTLLALMRSGAPGSQALPFWIAIAAFGDDTLWIVDEPTPPGEVLWAELSPWNRQRANFAQALAEAEQLIANEVPSRFEEALLVLVTDASAAATLPSPTQSDLRRVTLLVNTSEVDAHNGVSAEQVLAIANSLLP